MRLNFKYLRILLLVLCIGVSPFAFSQMPVNEVKNLITKNMNAIGLANDVMENYIINSNYKDAATSIEYVYIQQTYKGIRVFNVVKSLAFKNEILLYSSGKFLNAANSFVATDIPVIEAGTAVASAARHLDLKPVSNLIITKNNFKANKKIMFSAAGLAKKDIESELMWAQDDTGKVHLTWNVSIDVENSNDWWNVRVDALTGKVISKDNWTVHEKSADPEPQFINFQQQSSTPQTRTLHVSTNEKNNISEAGALSFLPPNVQNAAYRVVPYPLESLNYGSINVENNPWLKAGAGNNATSYGWHFDGSINYSITRGNNVYAYEDSLNTNSPGRYVTSSTGAPSINFDIAPDLSAQPYDSTNRNFGIVNLFYWNNIIHDVFYQYGFTELAGNFQADNLGRGGSGNDYVRAEAQDGSGTDNANFSTPADGSSGRMQMYLFSGPPNVTVTSPVQVANNYTATEGSLSLNNRLYKRGPVSAQVVFYNDASSGGATHEACDSSLAPANAVTGKIAYIRRGTCPFTTKMRTAQKYGAIGVVMVNNVAGGPISWGATVNNNFINIPGVMISQEDGSKIAGEIPNDVFINISTGMLYDGGIDNGIVTHEYGHGISTRLTGGRTNASCLSNTEQGGEGWSDYLALMLTTNWQTTQLTDGIKSRPVGTYALNQQVTSKGIRRVPYTTDMTIDTLTYGSMDGVLDGNGEPHRIGEIWCSALWDMTWNIIRHEGSITADLYNTSATGGNIIALKLVMEGMKLQPCRPGFLDARDAILAADSILFNNAHKCDIWNAFARRGMGYSAIQGSANNTGDQVPAFDVPSGIIIKRAAMPTIINAGSEVSFNTTVSCQCSVPSGSIRITDTIPPAFTVVNSSGGSLNGNVVLFNPISFSNSLESVTLILTLKATVAGCAITTPINDNREANQTGGLTAGRISGTTANWTPASAHSFSGASSWHAANVGSANNLTLTSDAFIPGSLSILSFWHYFVNAIYLDGGKVEISSNNGFSWIDAKPYFLQNGYNGILNANAPMPNTSAFTGTSYATSTANNGQFIHSVVDLSSFANQPIKIRFRYQTNSSNTDNQFYDGWYIDDISLTNGCGGISKFAASNSIGDKIDSASVPFFVMANSVLPLTLVNFSAKQAGRQVLLNWETSAELNIKNFEIERSTDGTVWSRIGVISAKELSGNSYLYYDQYPLDQQNFYRIRINDKDGVYSYTMIKKIELGSKEFLTLVPNPAADKTIIYFGFNAKAAVMLVTDLKGRVIQRHAVPDNSSSYIISTSTLSSGTYMIRIESKIGITTKKLIVVH